MAAFTLANHSVKKEVNEGISNLLKYEEFLFNSSGSVVAALLEKFHPKSIIQKQERTIRSNLDF